MPGGVAGDDDEPAALVLREQRGQVARMPRRVARHGVGQEVREPVQGFAGGDVRLRHELEDEDRAVDRHVAGDLERAPRSFGARRSRSAAPSSVGDAQRQTAATRSAASATRSSASRPERTASTIAA